MKAEARTFGQIRYVIIIDNIIISDDVVSRQFVCDLEKCKGGCCEEGDAGAPLADDELPLIRDMYQKVKHLLPKASVREVEKNGTFVHHEEFGWVTPTLASDKEICVYGLRSKDGIIECAFEKAYNEGLIPWRKPVSCHLYPVITEKGRHGDYEKVNYEPREKLCNPACRLGRRLQVPVYRFVKDALVRKYGEPFYEALEKAAALHEAEAGEKTS